MTIARHVTCNDKGIPSGDRGARWTHSRDWGAQIELPTDIAATGDREGRWPGKVAGDPSARGPPRILFSGTPSWEVVSADDLRIGARFVLGGARTLHAALRDAAQTIDRVHSTFMTCPAGRIDLGATPSQGLDRSGSDPVERDVLGRI